MEWSQSRAEKSAGKEDANAVRCGDARGREHGTRTIIGLVPFDETPSIHVDHLAARPVIAAQHVEATHPLAEPFAYLGGPRLFLVAEVSDKSVNSLQV